LPNGTSRTRSAEVGRTAAIPLALFVLTVALRLVNGPHPIDDAYITFRYAQNLATGQGLVYNVGERVLGTSSILFAALLGGFGRLLGAQGIPDYAQILSALCDAVTALLIYTVGLRMGMGTWLSTLAGTLLALSPLSIRYVYGGMESSLTTLLVVGALASHLAGKDRLTPHLVGFAFLARPDTLAVAAAVAMSFLVTQRRLPVRQLLIPALWIALSMLGIWSFYGVPLPHAVIAKSLPVYQAPALTNALQFYYQFGGLFVGPAKPLAAQGIVIPPSPLLALVLLPMVAIQTVLFVAGSMQLYRHNRRWLAFSIYPALVVVTYSLLGLRGSVMAEWYLVALTPFYQLPLTSGISWGIDRLLPRARRAAVSSISVLLLISQVAGLNLGAEAGKGWLLPKGIWAERELLYKEMATSLKDRFKPTETVALAEIGAFGYYCGCRVLDTVGLVSPEALPYYPLPPQQSPGLNAVPARLIQDLRPEYVASLDIFIRETLLKDEWFSEHYEAIASRESLAFGSRKFLVFQRTR
jgi:hypothetical protein